MGKCCFEAVYFAGFLSFERAVDKSMTGNSTRFVIMATKSVSEVSQPKAWVPPKSEKQKMTKPATSTKDV